MKLAICQELFVDWEWQRQCAFIAEVGYTGVEVAPFTLGPRITGVPTHQRETMRRQAEAAGLQIIGLHWLLAKTEGLHLTTADAAVREATSQYLVDLGRACADFGGNVMVLGSPLQRNVQPGMSTDEAYANAAEVISRAMRELEKLDVNICIEPLTLKETDFINTCADALRLIDMVGSPNVKLHQDVKAMLGAEADPIPVLIERYADRVGHFHVNDTNLLGPGMGETDFAPIFRALLDVDYTGWVSVEVFDYAPGCERIARDSYEYMRDTISRVQR